MRALNKTHRLPLFEVQYKQNDMYFIIIVINIMFIKQRSQTRTR